MDPSSKIYIAGNNGQLGNWNPETTMLDNTGQFWEREFFFNAGEKIEFKFTRGSWDTEALNENGEKFNNHSLQITGDTVLTYFVESWQNPDSVKHFNGGITGKVNYHRNMEFEDLLPRDIIVWLPPGYDENPGMNYPVLYMHDGQNIIDPATSFTKVDWQIDEAADSLIRNNFIEPLIVVGIYNTIDRSEEYSPTPKGIQYMLFIIKKLKPFIDSTYRTLPDRKNTAVGGSSSGGLITLMLAWNFSAYFSKAACFSPAFKYDDFDYTKKIEQHEGKRKDLTLYIYNGGQGIDTMLQSGIDKMVKALKEQEFKIDENLFVEIDSAAEHTESAWAKKVDQMLQILFPKVIENEQIEESIKINNEKISQRNILSNRFRVQGTTVSTLQDEDFAVNLPALLNLNYRFSNLDSVDLSKNFSTSFSVEPGLNLFFDDLLIFPYLKIGPEFRFYKLFYFDFHLGTSIPFPFGFYPFLFYGSEIGYIFNQTEDFSFEFELGFNGINPYYLYYFALSFSF